jgi:hypothetical protein
VFDSAPKFLALDEEANDQIVHRGRCREAHSATDEARDACPQSDMFIRDAQFIALCSASNLVKIPAASCGAFRDPH